jgi:DNA-binding CsgD family transcriptional regulator
MFARSTAGTLLKLSPSAGRLVHAQRGLYVDASGTLRAVDAAEDTELNALLIRAATVAEPQVMRLDRESGTAGIFLIVTISQTIILTAVEPCVLPPTPIRNTIDKLFAFTKTESKLVWNLLETCNLTESVEIARSNRNTAKSHLNAIFQKTRTRRQTELIRLLAKLSGVLHLED